MQLVGGETSRAGPVLLGSNMKKTIINLLSWSTVSYVRVDKRARPRCFWIVGMDRD